MANVKKKPAVRADLRKQWLARCDAGESPPQIAEKDDYDVRTVRKALGIERQDRERRETRLIVLREATERHYADLYGLAKDIKNAIENKDDLTIIMIKKNPLWAGLKEHLPRSPLWRTVSKWEELGGEVHRLHEPIVSRCREKLRKRFPAVFSVEPQQASRSDGAAEALAAACEMTAIGTRKVDDEIRFLKSKMKDGLIEVRSEPYLIGPLPAEEVAPLGDFFSAIARQSLAWPQLKAFAEAYRGRERATEKLNDELNVIILRRIVPGKCRFCPI